MRGAFGGNSITPFHMSWRRLAILSARRNARCATSSLCDAYRRRWHRQSLRIIGNCALIPAIETHRAKLGRTPYLVAADAGFYSAKNETAAKAKGVKRVCIPNRSTQRKERRREQRK